MLIYNSLSKTKEEFQPLDGNKISIYACGPTVYDYSHIGHARIYILWDVIQRYLRFRGYAVTYVRNITDIEDKIINRAKELGVRPELVARKYLYEFWRDMDELNVAPPDVEPRATEFLHEMIAFIQGLIANGHAYESHGDVYFSVSSLPHYGKLTRQNLEDMMSGSREQVLSQAELEKRKRHPADFALWKSAPDGETGWTSPWGFGRPGWHLECSTMIKHVLGETIDLHGGGEDLLFPHHENEVAQSEGLHGKPIARFFVHNSFVQVNGEKMAKSLGNFKTIRDLLRQFNADDIRLFTMQSHYRNPIDFSVDSLGASRTAVQRLVKAAQHADADHNSNSNSNSNFHYELESEFDLSEPLVKQVHQQFIEAMDNDFNTAQAIAVLFSLADTIAKEKDAAKGAVLATALRKLTLVLGFRFEDHRQVLKSEKAAKLVDMVLELRNQSKQKKDYSTSDLIRSGLAECGISVMDTADGSTWEVG
jgi:cysteinyl-tRNA synthetase